MKSLFDGLEDNRRSSLGKTEVQYKQASSILTKASGFMGDYDFTLNPYAGCSFGCSYCYAAFFSRTEQQRKSWGQWVQVKENALQLLKRFRKKPLTNKTIYISSVTDPYQPIERELRITRDLLLELVDYHQPRVVIQTRSPLVTRDIDIFGQFKVIQVNMTVTTDSEVVRRTFEPLCPSNAVRLKAIKEISQAGIASCITMTPLLPITNPYDFAQMLKDTGVKKFVVQPFHPDRGKFTAGTRDAALALIKSMNWDMDKYKSIETILIDQIPEIAVGKQGFAPN